MAKNEMVAFKSNDLKVNGGWPVGTKKSDFKPGTLVNIGWDGSPPSNALLLRVDVEKYSSSGERAITIFDLKTQRSEIAVHTQIIEIIAPADSVYSALQEVVAAKAAIRQEVAARSVDWTAERFASAAVKKGNIYVDVTSGEVTDSIKVLGEMEKKEVAKLKKLAMRRPEFELFEATVMFPGCGPGRYIFRVGNSLANRHIVSIFYPMRKNRPVWKPEYKKAALRQGAAETTVWPDSLSRLVRSIATGGDVHIYLTSGKVTDEPGNELGRIPKSELAEFKKLVSASNPAGFPAGSYRDASWKHPGRFIFHAGNINFSALENKERKPAKNPQWKKAAKKPAKK